MILVTIENFPSHIPFPLVARAQYLSSAVITRLPYYIKLGVILRLRYPKSFLSCIPITELIARAENSVTGDYIGEERKKEEDRERETEFVRSTLMKLNVVA